MSTCTHRPLRQAAIECLPRTREACDALIFEAAQELYRLRMAGELRQDDLAAYERLVEMCR